MLAAQMAAFPAFDPCRIPGFPPEARNAFLALAQEPIGDFVALRAACLAHAESFEAAAQKNEFVSIAEARNVAELCNRLIDALNPAAPELSRHLVWAAARYFVHSHDADYDFSVAGLDDDIAVANAVACYLGHPEWCIST